MKTEFHIWIELFQRWAKADPKKCKFELVDEYRGVYILTVMRDRWQVRGDLPVNYAGILHAVFEGCRQRGWVLTRWPDYSDAFVKWAVDIDGHVDDTHCQSNYPHEYQTALAAYVGALENAKDEESK